MTAPYDYSFIVTTTPFSNGLIVQESNIMGEVTKKIMNTNEEHIKQALMQLGRLPPEEAEKLYKQLDIAESWIEPWYRKEAYEKQCEEEI